MTPQWTQQDLIEELARRLGAEAAAGMSERTLRYYRAEGLLDEPSGRRQRTPVFGTRHLLQLMAIRRLQAAGWSLDQIREALEAAGDDELALLAEERAPRGALLPPLPGAPLASERARRRLARRDWEGAAADAPAAAVDEAEASARRMPTYALLRAPDAAPAQRADGGREPAVRRPERPVEAEPLSARRLAPGLLLVIDEERLAALTPGERKEARARARALLEALLDGE